MNAYLNPNSTLFEEAEKHLCHCRQYLWKRLLDGKCPVEFSSLGRWWGNNPKEKRQAEIDIQVYFYLFSKSGFTKGCMDKAKQMGNVRLVSYKDIVGEGE